MGLFSFLREEDKHSANENETRNDYYNPLIKALGGSNSETATEEEALSIPTVQSIIEIVAGTIAQLPIYLYKYNDDGSVEQIFNDYREFLLNNEPNNFESAYNMKKNVVKDYLLYGSHRIYKNTSRNEVISLHSLPSDKTRITKYYKDGFILSKYEIHVNGDGGERTLSPDEVISILKNSSDGATSKGALYYGGELFSLMKKESEFQGNIYNNGAMPLGILKSENRLTQAAIDRMRESWKNLYGGSNNAGKTIILEEGLDYKAVSLSPKDLLMNETKKEYLSDVCRLFNIPESLVNSSANKYGSLEMNNISFLQYTLSPIITSIEDALNMGLLLEDEKSKGYFFAFDTSEVLKSTEKEKFEAIKTGLDSGSISINEARARINKKPIKTDVMKWTLGSVLYNPEDGTMMIPNMGIGIPGYEKENNNQTQGQQNNDNNEGEVQNEGDN